MGQGSSAEVTEGAKLVIVVVYALDERILVRRATASLVHVLTHHVIQVDEGVLLNARHENVARALIGGVQGNSERELLGLVGKTLNHRDDAARRDREVTSANASSLRGIKPAQRGERGVVVHHRLALSHHHHAGHASVEVIAHMHDLLVYLACSKGTGKAGGTCRTECTTHGTPRLRRDAHRKAVLRRHANALHGHAVRKAKQVLAATVLGDLARDLLDATKRDIVGKLGAKRLREVSHLVKRGDILDPYPVLNLLGAELGLTQLGEKCLKLAMRTVPKIELLVVSVDVIRLHF